MEEGEHIGTRENGGCGNGGFLGVVTYPVGFLLCRFSPFVSKSPCQFIFRCILSLVGDLFVLPHILHVNLIN